jgi:manganese transport protein
MNLVDSVVALNAALFVNAGILILAAAAFHTSGHQDVARLEEAHRLLAPLLGTSLAATLFAVALLCSGQASTITGTLAGQIVMEGFLRWRIQPWLRRLISRGLAIVPAAAFIAIRGADHVDDLLVLSQVVLSLQLAFAVIPLITFTSDRAKMGEFVNPPWVIALASLTAAIIVGLNAKLVVGEIAGWMEAAGPNAIWIGLGVIPIAAALALLLLYVTLAPWLRRVAPRLAGHPAEPPPPVSVAPPRPAPAAELTGPHRHIALALELGRADAAVIDHVLAMKLPGDAEIVLMHVAESAASRFLGPDAADVESREDRVTLEQIAERFRARGVSTRIMLGNGDVKSELARMVGETDVDLLVTGSHGHRFLGDLFFGATTSGLRHRVRCPVLTIRQDPPARR